MIRLDQYLNEALIKKSTQIMSPTEKILSCTEFIEQLKLNGLEVEGPDLTAIAYVYKKNPKRVKTKYGSNTPVPMITLDMTDKHWRAYHSDNKHEQEIYVLIDIDKNKLPIHKFIPLPDELDRDLNYNYDNYFIYNQHNANVISKLLYSIQ